MKSSEISAKYSWPSKEQKDEIHDSGVPDEVDIVCGCLKVNNGKLGELGGV